MKEFIDVHCLHKAADVWRRTSIHPELILDERGHIIFRWPNKPNIAEALREHLDNEGGYRQYVGLYKSLREEMNFIKGVGNGK